MLWTILPAVMPVRLLILSKLFSLCVQLCYQLNKSCLLSYLELHEAQSLGRSSVLKLIVLPSVKVHAMPWECGFRCIQVLEPDLCISTQRRVDSSLSLPAIEGIHLFVNMWNLLLDTNFLEHAVIWMFVPYKQSCKCCFHSYIPFVLLNGVIFFLQEFRAALCYLMLIVTLTDISQYISSAEAVDLRLSPTYLRKQFFPP